MDYNKGSIIIRLNFIRDLLKNKTILPLISFDSMDNEFVNNDCDTRNALNKSTYDFKYIISSQIGGKLLYIKSGTTGHTFHGICNNDTSSFEYAVKVVAYPKKDKGSIYDIKRPENAEIMILKALSYFIVSEQTPHIVLPITNFYTDITNFTNLIDDKIIDKNNKNNKKYNEFIEKYKNGEYNDKVSILISEWANNGDLLDFIKKKYLLFDPMHWKVLFFQIISTLAIIQSKYPSFRHNDLKANNILVQKIQNTNRVFRYGIMGIKFRVPNIGYNIKLWDFDFASIYGVVDNRKVNTKWTNAINITSKQNRYYDIHYFFNTLIRKGFFPEFMSSPAIPKETKDFVNRIVPDMYKSGKWVHERGRILVNDEYKIPIDILKDDTYFEEFKDFNKYYNIQIKNLDEKEDDIKISDIIKI